MKIIRSLAMWLFDNVYLGRLAPWVFGFAINRMPHKITRRENGRE